MKITIYLIVFVALFLYLAGTKIGLRPFSFSMNTLPTAIGWVLLVVAMSLINYDTLKKAKKDFWIKGYEHGFTDCKEFVSEELETRIKQLKEKEEEKEKQKK